MLEILKQIGGPGFLAFILLFLFGGALILFVSPRTRRFVRPWVLWVSGVYLVLGLPVVANAIIGALPPVPPSGRTNEPVTLFVFDGDNRRGRLAATVTFLKTRKPAEFWVLGEEWLIEGLIRAGYPRHTYGHETTSSTTREQMDWVRRFVAAHPGIRPAVLASRLQMPRIAALARATGLEIELVPSPLDVEPPTQGWRRFVPGYGALRASRDAIYEHAALIYYRRNGWIEGD
jgi:hypothetical protein